jgi:hypothetical protein
MPKVIVYKEPVSDVVQKYSKLVFSYPKEKIWNQKGVSLQRRVAEDPEFQKRVDAALEPANLEKYVVKEEDAAPTRCIDGRIIAGWDEDMVIQKRSLGPKVAGGTVHAALAHRVVDSEHMSANLLFEEDIRYVVNRFKEIGIGSGGHIDNNQSGSNTGCGAVDNINLILDRLQRPEHQEQLRGLAQMILGDAYDGKDIINEVIGRILYLDALKPTYMPKENNNPDGEFIYKKTVVNTLRAEADRADEVVPALAGPHNEVAMVLNFVPGTTFDNDRFSHDNNNEIQVFGWDVWHMYEEARRLYRYAMHHNVAEQRQAIEDRIKYVSTRTLLGISTLMVLTDGSLRLVAVTK